MPQKPYVGTVSVTPTQESQPTSDGQVHANKITANMNVLATDLGFYISLADDDAKFAIYDHNSGDDEPENLLGYTGIVTNSADRNNPVWSFGDLNVPVYLERGTTYWLAILSQYGNGDTGTSAWMKFLGATSDYCRLTSSDYWPTFPGPFGVPDECVRGFTATPHGRARGDLDITPGPVARNKDADW